MERCVHAPVVASFGLAVKVGALMVRGAYSTSLDGIALFRGLVFDAFGIVEVGPGVTVWGASLGKTVCRRFDARAVGACLNSSKLPVAGVGAVANNELDGHAD